MGRFTRWMARKGAVGGTARWAAKAYRQISSQNPNLERHEVFRAMVVSRYNAMPNPAQEQAVLASLPRVGSVTDLVAWILTAEAGFAQNTPATLSDFFEVIQGELRQFGLSEEEIRGTGVVEATARLLAQRYLEHKRSDPGAPDIELFKLAITDLYPTNEEARNHLLSRLPQTEGLTSVAIGACRLMGCIDEVSLDAAGDVIGNEMKSQGLTAEQIYGPKFVETVQRDMRSAMAAELLGIKRK